MTIQQRKKELFSKTRCFIVCAVLFVSGLIPGWVKDHMDEQKMDKPDVFMEETVEEPEVTIEEPEKADVVKDIVTAPADEEPEEEFVSISYIPVEYQKLCFKVGYEYGIAPELLIAIIEVESGGNPLATNLITGCAGLMQIHPKYALIYMERAGVTDIYDPESNIRTGCEILLEKFEKYCDLPLVLMLYHGEGNKAFTRARTGRYSNYCKKIMERMEEMQKITEVAYD